MMVLFFKTPYVNKKKPCRINIFPNTNFVGDVKENKVINKSHIHNKKKIKESYNEF
jgi:hypothetical protein